MNRFMIYTRGRTGSSALADDLDQHPDISCHQELFVYDDAVLNNTGIRDYELYYAVWRKEKHASSMKAYWKYLEDNAKSKGSTTVGVKMLMDHFELRKSEGIESIILNKPFKIIYLVRDPACEALSGAIAAQRNIFNIERSSKAQMEQLRNSKKVTIDPVKLGKQIDYINYHFDATTAMLQNISNPSITIRYEDYFSNKERAYRDILSFLDVSTDYLPEQQNRYVKVTSPGLRDEVDNIAEVVDHLEMTGVDIQQLKKQGIRE